MRRLAVFFGFVGIVVVAAPAEASRLQCGLQVSLPETLSALAEPGFLPKWERAGQAWGRESRPRWEERFLDVVARARRDRHVGLLLASDLRGAPERLELESFIEAAGLSRFDWSAPTRGTVAHLDGRFLWLAGFFGLYGLALDDWSPFQIRWREETPKLLQRYLQQLRGGPGFLIVEHLDSVPASVAIDLLTVLSRLLESADQYSSHLTVVVNWDTSALSSPRASTSASSVSPNGQSGNGEARPWLPPGAFDRVRQWVEPLDADGTALSGFVGALDSEGGWQENPGAVLGAERRIALMETLLRDVSGDSGPSVQVARELLVDLERWLPVGRGSDAEWLRQQWLRPLVEAVRETAARIEGATLDDEWWLETREEETYVTSRGTARTAPFPFDSWLYARAAALGTPRPPVSRRFRPLR